jgi:hypothetical protein
MCVAPAGACTSFTGITLLIEIFPEDWSTENGLNRILVIWAWLLNSKPLSHNYNPIGISFLLTTDSLSLTPGY